MAIGGKSVADGSDETEDENEVPEAMPGELDDADRGSGDTRGASFKGSGDTR